METNIQIFNYNDQAIEFDLGETNLMINATEMAKPFRKLAKNFLGNDQTKEFISACLNKQNSAYLRIETETDLVTFKQKSGTWMHRVLALKFAAWLNPYFELWVFRTIEEVLYGTTRVITSSLKESAVRRFEISTIKKSLDKNPEYKRLRELESLERTAQAQRGRQTSTQLQIFSQLINKQSL
jgi:hypothetical protein